MNFFKTNIQVWINWFPGKQERNWMGAIKSFFNILMICGWGLLAQANISGTATLSLVDGGTDCNGSVRLVEVHADVTGLTGEGGLAGINAFVLALDLSHGDLFSTVRHTENPVSFEMAFTDKSLVGSQGAVRISGWLAESDVPNGSYHLATIQFSGLGSSVDVIINVAESSLGSRVVGGFGPDVIAFTAAPKMTFLVPDPVDFQLFEAFPFWLNESVFYDLDSNDAVNILDYVKLFICTE